MLLRVMGVKQRIADSATAFINVFANQAAIAVDLLLKARRAEALLGDGGGDLAVVARLATAVDALEDEQREAGLKLLNHLARTLGA